MLTLFYLSKCRVTRDKGKMRSVVPEHIAKGFFILNES